MRTRGKTFARYQNLCCLLLMACNASIASAAKPAVTRADQVERLFYSVEQRRAIDQPVAKQPAMARRLTASYTTNSATSAAVPSTKQTTRVASRPKGRNARAPVVTGFLKRSDGVDTVFIDHTARPAMAKDQPELLQPSQVGQPLRAAKPLASLPQSTPNPAGKP
jgi:hypothetical protein